MIKYCLFFLFLVLFCVICSPSLAFAADDITAPISSVSLDPSSPDGKNGWYTVPVSVTINSTDLESGVKDINWQVNTEPWQKKSFSNTLNMVLNSSFEDNADGWEFVPAVGSVGARSNDYAKLGNYSLRTSSSQNGLSKWSNKESYVVVSPWKTVTTGVWIKGQDVLGTGAYFNVYILTTSGERLIYTSPKHVGTFGFVYEARDLVISSDTAYGLYFELVLDGIGTAYFDGVYASYASDKPQVVFNMSDNGSNVLSYYATDFAGNIEQTKSVDIEIDSVAPTNWRDFSTERAGNDHTLVSSITVLDNASGLNSNSSEFQYSPLYTFLWGYFSDYDKCSGTFNNNKWLPTQDSFSDSALSGTLSTPAVDYCNSNWLLCKGLRFRIEDMAGNVSTKEICINGPWVQVVDSDVMSLGGIDMLSGAPDYNSNALVLSPKAISNFSSSRGWEVPYYTYSGPDMSYNDLYSKYKPDDTVTELPTDAGIFRTASGFTVQGNTVPKDYLQKIFSNVLFVNGDLVIKQDLNMNVASGTIFVVNGDVLVDKNVDKVSGFFVVNGYFDTSYNGGFAQDPLVVFGGVYADHFNLSRSSFAFKNKDNPSEEFVFDAKYLVDFGSIFGNVSVKWNESED